MAKYVVGQIAMRKVMDRVERMPVEIEVASFRANDMGAELSVEHYGTLADAEKEAARLSHDRGFQEFAVFQLVETVKATEPVETADIKKVTE